MNDDLKWSAIETAPKDGTRIILFRKDLVDPITIGFWRHAECGWSTPLWHFKNPDPTHWMPLPDQPNT